MNLHVGIPYAFLNNSFIQPYFDYTSSTILNPQLIDFASDSGYIDYRKTLYGLRVQFRKLDYLFNPRKGIDISADLSAGFRNIQRNSHIEESYYDGMVLKKTTYRLSGDIRGYIPVGKHFVIAPRVQAGSLLAGPHYYNELFKIGGEGRIRGSMSTTSVPPPTYSTLPSSDIYLRNVLTRISSSTAERMSSSWRTAISKTSPSGSAPASTSQSRPAPSIWNMP